ncbi:hypothetical protein CAP35_05930 [Chitinophagaceae bacterium IBVUCB1]|nr:hypothetical protein CAP35_05930 [Chitinophagaceae bacterium IBVUCB1]
MKCIARILILILIATVAKAQDSTLVMSAPIDISQEGWHKVIRMTNGNTLLFHFELRKHIRVKVFDKDAKEIASTILALSIFNVNALDRSYFDGLHEIRGNAVLFVTQKVYNSETLLRITVDGKTGTLIAEDIAVKSKSFTNTTRAILIKLQAEEGYAIFCYNYKKGEDSTLLKILYYDSWHALKKEVHHAVASKNLDQVVFLGVNIAKDGSILAAIKTRKIIQQGSSFDSKIHLMYVPTDWGRAIVNTIQLPEQENVTGIDFLKNSFSNNINILVHSTMSPIVYVGLNHVRTKIFEVNMLVIPEDFSSVNEKMLKHSMAVNYIKKERNNPSDLIIENPILDACYTHSSGITTTIFKEAKLSKEIKQFPTLHTGKYLITKYNDNGEEIWATALQNSHYYTVKDITPNVFISKNTKQSLFEDITTITENTAWMVFNDIDSNFNKTLNDKMIDLYEYDKTNTVYYHINKKKVVTKKYFFGKPNASIYQQVYPGSQYFDESTNTLTVLTRKVDGNKETLHIATRKMEE